MSFSLRTTILATGCILAIGTSAARAQTPRALPLPRAGQLRHDAGDGQHPGRRLLLQRAAQRRPGSGQPCPGPGVYLLQSLLLLLSPWWLFHGGRRRRRMRAATNAPAVRMLVATTRTTRTIKPSRRKPMHRIPRSYSPLLAWDAPRCPYWQLEREY